ncbi:hypothetical protein GCM10023201_47810 [Actinomycetospora corticicola]|uniref:Uncharacterized protein n=1 Tax=Actinomycetospora corticicola TaxID=663602 RepID=A0A7Y9DYY1_9PSEU|nr:hypothetical protein [Actinomycetospora corticicola]NYD37955.1 hypothetical protein [Actinomycetospora corticicola]
MHSTVQLASTSTTTTLDQPGLMVLGVVAAIVLIAMWRPLLRLLLIAVVALVFIGLGVVVSATSTPAGSSPPAIDAPATPGTDLRARAGTQGRSRAGRSWPPS